MEITAVLPAHAEEGISSLFNKERNKQEDRNIQVNPLPVDGLPKKTT